MSEPEFEMYLSLMSKFLRLTGAQKADIAEELRIHLEERLAELTAQGKTREEAIRLALDEFGDAGALAWQFTLPHSQRRRRQLMRYSIGSFVALAGIFTLVSLTWPTRQDMPPALSTVVAQGDSQAEAAQPEKTHPVSPAKPDSPDSLKREIEQKLNEFIVTGLHFVETPLTDALQVLEQAMTVDILVDPSLTQASREEVVTLDVRQGAPIRGKTALELILRQVVNSRPDYVIKDGVILITDNVEEYEVQVYDCRDLLSGVLVQAGMGGGMGGGGFFSVPVELAQAVLTQNAAKGGFRGGTRRQVSAAAGAGIMGGQPAGPGMAANVKPPVERAATSPAGAALIRVIQSSTRPAEWIDIDGSGGSLSEFDGVIIVQHHQAVHRKIEDVLAKLRKVKHGQQQAGLLPAEDAPPLVIPPGKRLVTLQANRWEVPVNALQPGSRVDVLRFQDEEDEEGGKKPEVILLNAEIVLPTVTPLTINGFSRPTTVQVNSVNLIVTAEEAIKLHQTELTTPYPLKFLLRGDDDDDEMADAEDDQAETDGEDRDEKKRNGDEVRGEADDDDDSATEKDDDDEQTSLKPILEKVRLLDAESVEKVILHGVDAALRDRVQVKVDLITAELTGSRLYPMVGPAQLFHTHYRCTVDYSDIDRCDRPQELRDVGGSTLVVYQDHDHLIRTPQ